MTAMATTTACLSALTTAAHPRVMTITLHRTPLPAKRSSCSRCQVKDATSKPSESNNNAYALRLAETAAEFKIAMLRTCTKYAKYLDESTACNAEPRIEHLMERLNLTTGGNATAQRSTCPTLTNGSIQLSRRPCPVRRRQRSLTTSSTTSLQWQTPIRPRLPSCSCMPGIAVLAKSGITCAGALRVWRA